MTKKLPKDKNNKFISIILFSVFVTLDIIGCTILAEPTPELHDCETTPIETLEVNNQGSLYYIIVSSHEGYAVQRQKIYSSIIPDVFGGILNPNDSIIVSWVESDIGEEIENALPFIGEVKIIPTPVFAEEIATPKLIPTYTPDPNLIPGPKRDRIEDEIHRIEIENKKTLVDFHCFTVVPAQQTQKAQIELAKQNQNKNIDEVITSIQVIIENGTYYQEGHDAIELSSKIINSECGENSQYKDCSVIIFSDFDNVNLIENSKFDYSNSNLGIVLLRCTFWIENCETKKNEISNHFHSYETICFISANDTSNALTDFLRSKKCRN